MPGPYDYRYRTPPFVPEDDAFQRTMQFYNPYKLPEDPSPSWGQTSVPPTPLGGQQPSIQPPPRQPLTSTQPEPLQFNPPPQYVNDTPPSFADYAQSAEDENVMAETLKKFPMRYEAQDEYGRIAMEQPTKQPTSKWRKLGAAFVGATVDPMMGDRFLNADYYNKLADWQLKMAPALKSAELERAANANERQLAYQQGNIAVANRKATTAEQRAETYRMSEERKNRAQVFRESADKFKMEHPDWEPQKDTRTGHIWFVNPKDPSQKYDTQLEHGEATDLDMARWRKQQAESVANIRAKAANEPDYQIVDVIDPETGMVVGKEWARKPGAEETRTNVPIRTTTGRSGRGIPPTQVKTFNQNRFGELQRANPTLAGKVSIDPTTGQVKPKKQSSFNTGRLGFGTLQFGPSDQDLRDIEAWFQLPSMSLSNEVKLNPEQYGGGTQQAKPATPPPGAKQIGTTKSGTPIYERPAQ